MKHHGPAILVVDVARIGRLLEAVPGSATSGSLTFSVSGARRHRKLSGVFELHRFAVVHGAVVAVGTLTGTLETSGGFISSLARGVRLPVRIIGTSCEMLHLEVGPLPLQILGLRMDLGRSVLDLTAGADAEKLPGHLLCPIAGLLDDVYGLARQLNRILAVLR